MGRFVTAACGRYRAFAIYSGLSPSRASSIAAGTALVAAGPPAAHAALSTTPDSLPEFNGTVLAVAAGRLYLGGAITAVNGQTRTRLAAFSLTAGALDTTWKPTADDQVEALTAADGRGPAVTACSCGSCSRS